MVPKGPDGQWRPRGAGTCAIHVMKIATGQLEESPEPPKKPPGPYEPLVVRNGAAERSRAQYAPKKFARRRAALMTPERRARMARS